jgi:hypothetical protein
MATMKKRLGISLAASFALWLISVAQAHAFEVSYEPNWPKNWVEQLYIDAATVTNQSDRKLCEQYAKEFEKPYLKYALNRWLKKIVFMKKIYMSGKWFAGTYDPIHGIIWCVCDSKVSKSEHILTLHHEFSSLLFYNNKESFDVPKWKAFNTKPSAYMYSDEERWYDPETIKNFTSGELNSKLYNDGFITDYNTVSVEEDINRYAEYIFTQPGKLESISKKYKRVHMKINHLKSFYREMGIISEKVSTVTDE